MTFVNARNVTTLTKMRDDLDDLCSLCLSTAQLLHEPDRVDAVMVSSTDAGIVRIARARFLWLGDVDNGTNPSAGALTIQASGVGSAGGGFLENLEFYNCDLAMRYGEASGKALRVSNCLFYGGGVDRPGPDDVDIGAVRVADGRLLLDNCTIDAVPAAIFLWQGSESGRVSVRNSVFTEMETVFWLREGSLAEHHNAYSLISAQPIRWLGGGAGPISKRSFWYAS